MGTVVLGDDHFGYLAFGTRWEAVGDALRAGAPAWAWVAYAHAEAHYRAYDEAWTKHLPASRFDADGGAWLGPLRAKLDALAPAAPGDPITWVHELCLGHVHHAVDRFAQATDDGGLDDAGRRAAHELLAAHADRLGLPDAAARHRALSGR